MKSTNTDIFFEKMNAALAERTCVKITLSHPKHKNGLRQILVKPIVIKTGEKLSFTYRHETKDLVKNLDVSEGKELLFRLFGRDFLQADLYTTQANYMLLDSVGGGKLRTSEATITEAPSLSHDHEKRRHIDTQNNVYLQELGILNSNFSLAPGMQDKFRQIDKFLEIFDGILGEIQLPETFSIVDMGAGKGYLTFALYDYLTHTKKFSCTVRGVEFRPELVRQGNALARKVGFQHLSFEAGTIQGTQNPADILIALHACDTATDDAIAHGIRTNAQAIICSPCCHKQIRKQFQVSHEIQEILKNGILEERQAEIVTDGLRVLLLELAGYDAKVFEFISSEHTGKNLMITAVKSKTPKNTQEIRQKITAIKHLFGINSHYLETLLPSLRSE